MKHFQCFNSNEVCLEDTHYLIPPTLGYKRLLFKLLPFDVLLYGLLFSVPKIVSVVSEVCFSY